MPIKLKDSYGNKELRFFGVFKPSPPFHFYLMQIVGFTYFLYRFASRDYTVYGRFSLDMFNYPRPFTFEFLPIPVVHFTTFQFIYYFIPRPTPDIIFILQSIVIIACLLGILGILAKYNAILAFVIGLHLTGMMQSSNAELDGGTLALCLVLILALSPAKNFYGIKNLFSLSKRDVDYHWPVFLLFLFVGAFYTTGGINKIIDVGPHWPFVLHLDHLAITGIEKSLFVSSRYVNPFVSSFHLSSTLSVVAGVITLIGELFFITVLVLPRYRLFFVVSMFVLHGLVFLMAGINFIGSSFILLLCLDWNALVRKVSVYYDANCTFCLRSLTWIKRFDWFDRVEIFPMSKLLPGEYNFDLALLQQAMGLRDENGEIYYGADAFEQIAARCPLFWPFALLMKVPGAIYVARYVYAMIARNRMAFGCHSDGVCALPLKEGANVSGKE